MAKNLLTERRISTAKPKKTEYLLNDGEGLYLRIRPSGTKSWIVKSGKSKRTLGRYPNISLLQARSQLKAGQGLSETSIKTLDDLFFKWYEDYALVRHSDPRNSLYAYRTNVQPLIGHFRLEAISRGTCVSALDAIVKTGKEAAAVACLSILKRCFDWAYTREWVTHTPLYGVTSRSLGVVIKEEDRYLSSDEIVLLKDATIKLLEKQKSWIPHATAVWFTLATGARGIEVVSARSKDINIEEGVWNIPREVVKTDVPHIVHLNTVSRHLLSGFKSMDYIFKATVQRRTPRIHLERAALLRYLDKLRSEKLIPEEVEHFTAHDLRRTAATLMGELGIDGDVIDLCLNHKIGSKVRRTYQRQQRLADRQQAFEALGDYLVNLLDGLDWLPTVGLQSYPRESDDLHV